MKKKAPNTMLMRLKEKLDRDIYLWKWRKGLQYVKANFQQIIESTGLEFSQHEIDYIKCWTDALSDSAMRILVPKILQKIGYNAENFIYCFGCGEGGTVRAYVRGFHEYGMRLPHMKLFDSFQGLPDEDISCASHPLWSRGVFEFSEFHLHNLLNEEGCSDYQVFRGFFSDVLTKDLVENSMLRPAAVIDIDCDLYISTYEALDFMFGNALVEAGTLIVFDDWGDTELWEAGESRAFKEISEKYAVLSVQICSWGVRPNLKKIFLILDPGKLAAQS